MSKVVSKPSFEQAITELEEVVNSLENGEVELENAIKLYEKQGFKSIKNIKLDPHKIIPHNGGCLLMKVEI